MSIWPKREDIVQPESPSPEQLFSPSEIYHENSTLRPSETQLYTWISHVNSDPGVRTVISKPYTHYPGCPVTQLPRDFPPTSRSFEETVTSRRSRRDYTGESMRLDDLSRMLMLGDGITETWHTPDGFDWGLRTAPSGGGLYPIETYCAALRVEGLAPGLYFYRTQDHALELILEGPLAEELAAAVPGQVESFRQGCVCFLLTAVMQRIKFKYGERGYRFLLLEAGHIAQNLLLAAESAGLGAFAIGGFMDDPLNRLLRLDGVEEAVVYAVVVGQTAAARMDTSAGQI